MKVLLFIALFVIGASILLTVVSAFSCWLACTIVTWLSDLTDEWGGWKK